MKAEELQGKTVDELQQTLLDLKKQQMNLRFQKSQGQLENTAQIRTVRRDIARVKTFMSKHESEAPAKKAAASKTKKSGGKAA